jgi:hypothetical protein
MRRSMKQIVLTVTNNGMFTAMRILRSYYAKMVECE